MVCSQFLVDKFAPAKMALMEIQFLWYIVNVL